MNGATSEAVCVQLVGILKSSSRLCLHRPTTGQGPNSKAAWAAGLQHLKPPDPGHRVRARQQGISSAVTQLRADLRLTVPLRGGLCWAVTAQLFLAGRPHFCYRRHLHGVPPPPTGQWTPASTLSPSHPLRGYPGHLCLLSCAVNPFSSPPPTSVAVKIAECNCHLDLSVSVSSA